jgi:hypothetical protein
MVVANANKDHHLNSGESHSAGGSNSSGSPIEKRKNNIRKKEKLD